VKKITLKTAYSAFKTLALCLCRNFFQKKDKHISCKKAKHFRKKYSLHFKFLSLFYFHEFFKSMDVFSKKHPFILHLLVFILAGVGSYFVLGRFTIDEDTQLQSLISKGFFIAPLVTLMVSNQKAIVNHFSAVLFYDEKNKGIDVNIDKDSIVHKKDIGFRDLMIGVIYAVAPNERSNDYIILTRRIIKESLAARDGNDYKNATAMIFSGSSLMVGFFMLLFGFFGISLTFLFYSLFIILTKEILGIRSIVKRSLFARFLSRLDIEKNKISPKERANVIFGP
jgi:hypothetical protein